MNFNCVFDCGFKKNNIEESEFVTHLREKHGKDLELVAKKENIPVSMAEMISVSNSKVFINC
ncbi:MAG: hypothetical protein HOK63_02435 [Thaumarchaeota archaeon]|nr:hypothetical protein [Nitrososphaerota archaeon]MBT5843107.1 hypothetical protein [Nitrososphaerota archaeon]MBT6468496.1 hypothetical protein [Nitrososphaerota archaeon]